MSREKFRQLQIVGHVRSALNELSEYLDAEVTLQIPDTSSDKYEKLCQEYEDFYDLSLEQRLVYAGYKTYKENEDE